MDQFVVIATYGFPYQAHTAQVHLESFGIYSHLKDDVTIQVDNLLSPALGGVKLMVRSEDAQQAHDALVSGGYLTEKDSPLNRKEEFIIKAKDKTVCPFCQSSNIRKERALNVFVLTFYFILGLFIPIFRGKYRCFNCGKHWRFR